ncbi:NAD(P)-dependent oxidoreductase [Rhodococcus sp. D2-41]|uniref:NAD(P)-dependent oxidoreductase n=1 Tax=Speluncibacter jeojiensis TaxID=2710754 RepID=A0A9X4LYS1_9ACTN|nr:NAD(P)-dependent oxidoreductase [Rhodococcus sp. D2-41]MDG3010347.1 NAD(P)-dependent oxidoreductase [Rhodococcus sp. D2-41]MDG3014081.1 NAD(P)-dependent oxidoreductase [Corynebacteriales bacterium D3-21]
MRIFLAGASGVIGRRLVPALTGAGHEVWGTTRRPDRTAAIAAAGARPVLLDALDAEAVRAAVAGCAPDVVIHQLTDLASRDFAANSRIREQATRNLVDAARTAGIERLLAQSIAFVHPDGTRPATEQDPIDDDPARAVTLDGVRALESTVAEIEQSVILRYGMLYGPGTWYAPDGLMAEQAHAGTLPAGPEVTSFVHVDDAVDATVAALDWPAGIVNIVDDEPASGRDWAPVFAAAVGAPAPEPTDDGPIGRPISNALARSRGWSPRHSTWRTGFTA